VFKSEGRVPVMSAAFFSLSHPFSTESRQRLAKTPKGCDKKLVQHATARSAEGRRCCNLALETFARLSRNAGSHDVQLMLAWG